MKKIRSMKQVRNLEEGEIIPMADISDCLDGRRAGLLIEKDDGTMLFLIKVRTSGYFYECLIPDINKGWVSEKYCYGERSYCFDGYELICERWIGHVNQEQAKNKFQEANKK